MHEMNFRCTVVHVNSIIISITIDTWYDYNIGYMFCLIKFIKYYNEGWNQLIHVIINHSIIWLMSLKNLVNTKYFYKYTNT